MGLSEFPMVKRGDDVGRMICEVAERNGVPIADGDIVVVAQKIVSKAEGMTINLKDVNPSQRAVEIADFMRREPELIEVILNEAKKIVRLTPDHLIVETRHGFCCANAGVDKSNVSGGDSVTLLPKDPDLSAQLIRRRIKELTGKNVAVIISDTYGRPKRVGHIDLAIGVAGMKPILDLRGRKDLFGYTLRVKRISIADELASAAELVIGNADEAIPVAIIRGYKYEASETAKAVELIIPPEKDLFP